jgi:hypothetical protein
MQLQRGSEKNTITASAVMANTANMRMPATKTLRTINLTLSSAAVVDSRPAAGGRGCTLDATRSNLWNVGKS